MFKKFSVITTVSILENLKNFKWIYIHEILFIYLFN